MFRDFKLRIEPEEASFSASPDEAGTTTEEIKCQPDLLPVPPLPDGPRKWGTFHLLGYWVAEAFGTLFVSITCLTYRTYQN